MGAKKGSPKESPLHGVVKKGDLNKAKKLLETEGKALLMKTDRHGMTPLACAAESGRTDLVALFVKDYKADVNVDTCGFTPLFLAVQNDHLETVKVLLEAKANVNAVDKERGASPVHLAASNNYLPLMELLFQNGANPNATASNGLTPTHMAVSEGYTSAVKLLLDSKADIHQQDNEGRTPLVHSIMGNHPWVAALLMQRGADLRPDNDGVSPVDIVKEHSLGHMAGMFQRYGDIDVFDRKTACGACMGAMVDKKRCGRCKKIWYCSLECQKHHWSHHKLTCKPVTKKSKAV